MFGWLKRRLIDRSRRIFKFYDGFVVRGIDPLLAWRQVMTHPDFDPGVHGPAFDRGEPEAYAVILKVARDVFGVPEFTKVGQPGLTEQELIGTFKRFLTYCEDLKKSIETSQTPSLPTTDSTPSTAYTVPPELLERMKEQSDSTSTQSDNSSEIVGCC